MLYFQPVCIDEHYGVFQCEICKNHWVWSWEDTDPIPPDIEEWICPMCSQDKPTITKYYFEDEEVLFDDAGPYQLDDDGKRYDLELEELDVIELIDIPEET